MIFFFSPPDKIISIHWSIVRVNRRSAIMWNGVFNYNMWNVVVINGIVTLNFFSLSEGLGLSKLDRIFEAIINTSYL